MSNPSSRNLSPRSPRSPRSLVGAPRVSPSNDPPQPTSDEPNPQQAWTENTQDNYYQPEQGDYYPPDPNYDPNQQQPQDTYYQPEQGYYPPQDQGQGYYQPEEYPQDPNQPNYYDGSQFPPPQHDQGEVELNDIQMIDSSQPNQQIPQNEPPQDQNPDQDGAQNEEAKATVGGDKPKNFIERIIFRIKNLIRKVITFFINFLLFLWWAFWAICHMIYHRDNHKKTFWERNLFLNRTIPSLASILIAFLLFYGVLTGIFIGALFLLSYGFWGNPQFDLTSNDWIPAGNPNS